jgi:hypothetical protein
LGLIIKNLLLPLLLIILSANNVLGFTLNTSTGAAFEADEVAVNVASITCTNLGVSNEELLSLAEEAVDRFWNRVSTSRLQMIRGQISPVAAAFGTDVITSSALSVPSGILISCNTSTGNFANSSILAVALPTNATGRTINGSLILINDQANNQFASRTRDEQISIIAHEIGHAIGLGHSSVEDSLMFFKSLAIRVELGEDDLAGVTFLYPREQPFGCGTIDFKGTGSPLLYSAFLGLLVAFLISRLRYLRFPKISPLALDN